MKKVREGLYIGDIGDASSILSGSSKIRITHLLSLLSLQFLPNAAFPSAISRAAGSSSTSSSEQGSPATAAAASSLVRKSVPLNDMESENLLDHLEECLAFVEEGVQKGSVLVHCLAGVSRSAAVVLAYIMKSERVSLDDAFVSLRKASDRVCPNAGFMNQLRLFQLMDYKIDKRSSTYKGFLLQMLGENCMNGEKVEWSRFAEDPEAASRSTAKLENFDSGLGDGMQERRVSFYRCKKCRRIVASQDNVLGHSPGVGQEAFKWRKRGKEASDIEMSKQKCSSIFVEPMKWMKTVQDGVIEGKLLCAKCEARLGNFNWAGLQCSCGTWVNPAFQLHRSRIDEA